MIVEDWEYATQGEVIDSSTGQWQSWFCRRAKQADAEAVVAEQKNRADRRNMKVVTRAYSEWTPLDEAIPFIEIGKRWVVLSGNPVEGFTVYGTFASETDAVQWGDVNGGVEGHWWIAPVDNVMP